MLTDPTNNSVLLCSPTGIGKTSVTLEVAHNLRFSGHTVVYVNPRDIHSVDDLACEISSTLEMRSFPGERPVREALGCLRRLPDDTILILENIDSIIHPEDDQLEPLNSSDLKDKGMAVSSVQLPVPITPVCTSSTGRSSKSRTDPPTGAAATKDDLLNFIAEIGQRAPNVKLLMTSREEFDFVTFSSKVIILNPLSQEESVDLLMTLDPSLSPKVADELAKSCEGMPLTLRIVVSLLRNEPAEALSARLSSSSPLSILQDLSPPSVPADSRINHNLDVCYRRLPGEQRVLLVKMAVYPCVFSLDQMHNIAKGMNKGELENQVTSLIRTCFLRWDQNTGFYSLHPFIRTFCLAQKQLSLELRKEHNEAKSYFVEQCIFKLLSMNEKFFSKHVKSSIEEYRNEKHNIKQVLTWCAQDSDLDEELSEWIIDTAIDAAMFLSKMMRRQKFEDTFNALARQYRHDAVRYSQCVTYVGTKIVLSCACATAPCPTALNRALSYLEESNEMQIANSIGSGHARAQCLSKLGRCYARLGRVDEGFELLNRALSIRRELSIDKGNVKNHVMGGACFNDLAGMTLCPVPLRKYRSI